jgi:hypothetical protein
VNAFETYDRYDFALSLLVGVAMSGALVLGAPLWAIVLIMFIGSLVEFIRHFNDIGGPDGRESRPKPGSRLERVRKHSV